MTEEMKKECYKSYLAEVESEWGTTKGAITFEEFCKEMEECKWKLI